MKKLSLILFSLSIIFTTPSTAKDEKTIFGFAKVIDGDTIKINGISVRLFGIDAPEKNQICLIENQTYNCGLKSKNFLQSLITGTVECSYNNLDRYGRIIGKCISHTKIVNQNMKENFYLNYIMIRNGHAVEYKRYSKGEYSEAENLAIKEKRGIWRGKFDRPEDWRRKYK
tara:strand:- start:209 stop:721 length:513 start_codon:yes stop_codon:yes gene_type:complete